MNANELPDAKLLRKKLKNGLIVDKWDLVTIIEKQEAMLRQQQAQIEALKKKQEEVLVEVKTSWTAVSPVSGIPRESAHQLYAVLKEIMK